MKKIIKKIKELKRILFKTEHDKLLKKWFMVGGDKNFRLDHDLNEDSVVFDVGGYKGKFIDDIYSKFKCNIYSFEPVKEFFDCMKSYENERIRVYNFGLANESRLKIIYLDKDESSVHGNGLSILVQFVDILEFLDKENIDKIDLIEINIEGGEYDLLDHMINYNIVKKFKNIQIQFHKNVKNYVGRRIKIKKQLLKTHELTYDFPFIMENWRLRKK